jgi:hypothetical protein
VRQLALLNTKPIATDVVRHVCRLDGPFASLDGLSRDGNAEVLATLAEIDTEIVVTLLDHVLAALSDVELKALDGDLRRQLVRAVEKLSFVENTFERGAGLMLSLAVAENETWGNNATGQFKRLFPVFLADTAAGPEARLQVIDDVLKSDDVRRLRLAVDALLEGAKTDFFNRSVGPEIHGSRPALEPWNPKIWKEAWDYIQACVRRLTNLARRADEIGVRARTGLGHQFRMLITRGLIDFVEEQITEVIAVHPYWPEATSSLGDVLQFDRDALEPGVEDRVRALMQALTPYQLADRVRFLVTEMPWDYPEDEQLDFDARNKRQVEVVRQLANEILNNNADELADVLPQLSRGEQRMALEFGRALAKLAPDPLVWRGPIMVAYESTGLETKIPSKIGQSQVEDRSLGLLAGYFAGLAERNPSAVEEFKREAAQSETFAAALPLVCADIGITGDDVKLVCKSLNAGVMPLHMAMQWVFGGVLGELPPDAVTPLFDQLFKMEARGYSIAIELMGMYVHRNAKRLEHLRPQLRQAANYPTLRLTKRGSHMDEHQFSEMMKWILAKGPKDPDARAIALTLAKQVASDPDGNGRNLIKPLLPQLMRDFSEIVWPLDKQSFPIVWWRGASNMPSVIAIRSTTLNSPPYCISLKIRCSRGVMLIPTSVRPLLQRSHLC